MEVLDILLVVNPFCQLMQAGHIIVGFLYVLLAAIIVALCFIFDVVTWFSLKLYDFYLPFMVKAWAFLSDGLSGYNC